jgi:hypothetical protein
LGELQGYAPVREAGRGRQKKLIDRLLLETKYSDPVQKKTQRNLKRKGRKQAEVVEKNKPLSSRLAFYLDAWFDLDTERSVSFGVGPIPWHAIINYASTYRLAEWHRDLFVYHIKGMDTAYRKMLADKAEEDKNKNTTVQASRTRRGRK